MRFIVLQLYGSNEINGCEVIVADTEGKGEEGRLFYESDDSTQITRKMYDFLLEGGFKNDPRTGKVGVTIFSTMGSEKLVYMPTFYKYINPIGGIHNPCLLYSTGEGIPGIGSLTKESGGNGVVEIVQKFYGKRRK